MPEVRCRYCDEPVLEGDKHVVLPAVAMTPDGEMSTASVSLHSECMLRATVGSVGCQRGLCPNCGDPPGMTRREGAKAAVELFRLTRGRRLEKAERPS